MHTTDINFRSTRENFPLTLDPRPVPATMRYVRFEVRVNDVGVFGQFLVRTKVISVEQLRDALDMMSRENLLLGQLAVEEGYLSESQANTINRKEVFRQAFRCDRCSDGASNDRTTGPTSRATEQTPSSGR